MTRLLGIIVALLSIGGCSTSQLTVREDSVIPDSLLSEAYKYTEVCIAGKTDKLDGKTVLDESNIGFDEIEIIGDCMDDMFILYANTNYTVFDKDVDGNSQAICSSDSIDDINRCLSL